MTPLKGPVPVLAASSTSTAIRQPVGPKSSITDAAVVEQLARMVPPGRTSGYAGGPKEKNRYAMGQLYLDTGKGPGMIRAFVYKGGLSAQTCSTKPLTKTPIMAARERMELRAVNSEAARRAVRQKFAIMLTAKRPGCHDLPDGGRALVDTSATTGESTATVDHGNGIVVVVYTANWLAWNGQQNPRGTVALTPAQVLNIAAYPGWGARMDSALVRKAATDHPSMPTVY